jgi:hypothetical protein
LAVPTITAATAASTHRPIASSGNQPSAGNQSDRAQVPVLSATRHSVPHGQTV